MKAFFLSIIFVFSLVVLQAQVRWGVTTGFSPSYIPAGDLAVSTIDDTVRYTMTNTRNNLHVGGFIRLQTSSLYLKSDLNVGITQVSYDKDDLMTGSITSFTNQFEYNLNIPVEVGVDLGYGFVHGGLVWSNFFKPEEANVILNLPNQFSSLFQENQFRYLFGIGLDFSWQASIEINYIYTPNTSDYIVIDNNIQYDFNLPVNSVMVNFNWNFNREGWE